ncbi:MULTISPECIES: hypothetical protein [Mycolicibacterium]|nr:MULTISPECIES: hypothetical protein [Mycolicibacterium]
MLTGVGWTHELASLNALMLHGRLPRSGLIDTYGNRGLLRFFSGRFWFARAHIHPPQKGTNMETAARSCLMAGVALVGAGAIAAAPIHPVLPASQAPAIPSSSASVELNALVNPIELWAEVLSTTATNLGSIAQTVLENPAPILGKIIDNQLITAQVFASLASTFASGFADGVGLMPQQIEDSIRAILAGDIYQGSINLATAFLSPIVRGAFGALNQLPNLIAVLQNPFVNTAAVIETAITQGILNVGFPLLTQVLAPVGQIGLTGQAIYDGLQANDFEAVANAIISFPSDMVNTIVNGNTEMGFPGLIGADFGLVPGLLAFGRAIADSIQPPVLTSPPSPSVAPDLNAETVTIDTSEIDGGQNGSADGPAAVSDDAPAEDAAAEDAGTGDLAGDIESEEESAPPAAEVAVVKNNPLAKLGKLGPDSNRQGRAAAAVKSLGDDVGKAVKKIGDDVKKALGVKPKKEKENKEQKATADAGEE